MQGAAPARAGACQLARLAATPGPENHALASGPGLRDNLGGKGHPRTAGSLLTVWLGADCQPAHSWALGCCRLRGAGTTEAQARVPAAGYVPAGSTGPRQELGDTVLPLGQN